MTQTELIKKHLEDGRTITPIEALSLYGCFRLGARIYNLKQQGVKIESKTITKNGKHFAQYRMAYGH